MRHLDHLKMTASDEDGGGDYHDVGESHQMGRHFVLLLLLLMSMIIVSEGKEEGLGRGGRCLSVTRWADILSHYCCC